jgi:hypothetical protein
MLAWDLRFHESFGKADKLSQGLHVHFSMIACRCVAMDQATAANLPSASEFAQSRRLRMASSTSASASWALRASASATSARSSTAVNLSFWASIYDWACPSALHAPCSLCSAVTVSSRCVRSMASARISASRNLSRASAQTDCARASVSRACSSIPRKTSAA